MHFGRFGRSNTQKYSHLKVLYWTIFLVFIFVLVSKTFFGTRNLHAYVQFVYIVKAKYQIVRSKAVVGVERPMKELSLHMQNETMEKLS